MGSPGIRSLCDSPHISNIEVMISFKASIEDYKIVCQLEKVTEFLPYVKNDKGNCCILCVSPYHGRSFVLNRASEDCWIIGKGNGLSYTTRSYILTSHINGETWGGLTIDNALRDFRIGNEIRKFGVKTNIMHGVLALDRTIVQDGKEKQAALLQYSVECPYRISDFGFILRSELDRYVSKWNASPSHKYLYAAEVLVRNLRLLHDHHVMHNAMYPQNYTWALELLDFEASRTDTYSYDNPYYEACVPMLLEAEIVQTFEIINYIAWCLGETPNYPAIESIFGNYGYRLNELK